MSNSTRNVVFDAIRVVAAVAVVTVHTIGLLKPTSTLNDVAWWMSTGITILTIWAVPIFVMLSGALLLTKVADSRQFYTKRFLKVGIPTIFWVVFYYLFTSWQGGLNLSFQDFVYQLVVGQVGHLYFLILILELYLLTPLLGATLRQLTREQSAFLICLFWFIAAFWGLSRFSLTLFVPYLGYFLAGGWLAIWRPQLSTKTVVGFWVVTLLALLGSRVAGAWWQIESYYYFTHGNPLIIAYSVATFLLFQRILGFMRTYLKEQQPQFTKLATHTLTIYLIHPLIITLLSSYILPTQLPWSEVLLLILVVLTLAYLCSWLFATITACLPKKFF